MVNGQGRDLLDRLNHLTLATLLTDRKQTFSKPILTLVFRRSSWHS